MKHRAPTLVLIALAITWTTAEAKRATDSRGLRFSRSPDSEVSRDQDLTRVLRTAPPSTTVLGSWSFDSSGGGCNPEAWTSHDITAQPGDFFHVDDFAGLGGGTFGRLYPLAGSQSLWCGARPNPADDVVCGYAVLPGYGNSWYQQFCTKSCISVVGDVVVDFRITWDSEPAYDYSKLEFADACGDTWTRIAGGLGYWDGTYVDSAMAVAIPMAMHSGDIRIRFTFASDGAWSDEDGLWDTDGAVIIDNLRVDDATGAVLAVETFEDEAVGDIAADDWESCTPPGFGDYAALFPGNTLVQEDACNWNPTCMWAFISGSTDTYWCGGFQQQIAVPMGNERGQYLMNEIWSPWIPYVGSGEDAWLSFDRYADLPVEKLVFYVWHIRSIVDGCAGNWEDYNFVYYIPKGWHRDMINVGPIIQPGATHLQVALGAWDMCGFWCGVYSPPIVCHTHAPLFDNVELTRVDTNGPTWYVRDIDLFQDTFADDGTLTGTARADMANDILLYDNPSIRPGDSCLVEVSDPEWGLAGPPLMYVAVWPQGQPGKGASGIESKDQRLSGGVPMTRFPVVDSLTHDGATWYCVRMDSTLSNPDRFCVDLADSVFTPCDTICFFFCAENTNGEKTYWTRFTGTTDDMSAALNAPDEFQVLPGGGWKKGGDILYVDGFDGLGAQVFFEYPFRYMGIYDEVDRYDVRGPASLVGNHLASRVKNINTQIMGCYRKIIWNTGDLASGTIGDGTGNPEKSNDAYLLNRFLDLLPNTGGVYFSGDNIAQEWESLAGVDATSLKSFITHNLTDGNHAYAGFPTNPKLTGVAGGIFEHITGPDELIAFGGCPVRKDFDVLEPTGTAQSEMRYPGGGAAHSAVISQVTVNSSGFSVGVILSGFSFHEIRDVKVNGILARVHHLFDVINWLDNSYPYPTGTDSPASYVLSQNHPNPFNPVTTIDYALAARGPVTLRVYNVAGQLVRTLVDETAGAGAYRVEWDGRDSAGSRVSSGVYFYKLTSGDFSETRKMVLLK